MFVMGTSNESERFSHEFYTVVPAHVYRSYQWPLAAQSENLQNLFYEDAILEVIRLPELVLQWKYLSTPFVMS